MGSVNSDRSTLLIRGSLPDGGVSIYGLIDPTTNEIKYVGKTVRLLRIRLRQHILQSKNIKISTWVAALKEVGHEPAIFEIERSSNSEWKSDERFWIAYFKAVGAVLFNATDGGDYTTTHTPEVRARISASNRERMRDPAIRQHLSEKSKAAWKRDDVRTKSLKAKGYMKSPEWRKMQSVNKKKAWAEDPEFRAKMAAGQERTDRTAIAKEFWSRPEYRERNAAAVAARKARGWNQPKQPESPV